MKKDDGGSAFPHTNSIGVLHPGMSLRDWFIGQALCGILARPSSGYTK